MQQRSWLRGLDLNQRPSGYEPDELPGCSTPRVENRFDVDVAQIEKRLFAWHSTENAIGFAFAAAATSLMCERKNSCRHSQFVGPGICGALVSEEDAGGRAAPLVRAAFRFGRGKLDVLFRARTANGRALVRSDAGGFHVRRKVAPTVFLS